MLIKGPDLDRPVGVLGTAFSDPLRQPFLKASCSSALAALACLGRGIGGLCSSFLRESHPRCGQTLRPSREAIHAATLGPVHSPPSAGGSAKASRNTASSS